MILLLIKMAIKDLELFTWNKCNNCMKKEMKKGGSPTGQPPLKI